MFNILKALLEERREKYCLDLHVAAEEKPDETKISLPALKKIHDLPQDINLYLALYVSHSRSISLEDKLAKAEEKIAAVTKFAKKLEKAHSMAQERILIATEVNAQSMSNHSIDQIFD